MPFGKDRVDFAVVVVVVVVVILLLLWTVVALEGAVRMELVEPIIYQPLHIVLGQTSFSLLNGIQLHVQLHTTWAAEQAPSQPS